MSDDGAETIRQTPFGSCIGARILDITTEEWEDVKRGEPNRVYFHLDNGQTFFATMGFDGDGLMGFLEMKAKDGPEDGES